MTWTDMVCEYGQRRFALRVPADCLDIVLCELDEAEVKWLSDEKLPSQIRDALRANYEFAEKQGGRPCLIIDPMMHLLTWGYAVLCRDDKLHIYDFAGTLTCANHEIPVLIPNETLIAVICDI